MTLPEAPPAADTLDSAADDLLVARAVDGDAEAFGVLVRRHSPLLRAYTARIVGSLTAADDIVQETFITAWGKLPSLRDRSSVKAWLMRIATRRALRAVSRVADAPLEDVHAATTPDPADAAVRSAQVAAVGRALDRLPEDQRRCWLLRELGDLSYQEIAAELDLTPAQVRGRLARARADLTVRLEGWR